MGFQLKLYQHALVNCYVIEACDQLEQSNLTAWLQITCGLKAPSHKDLTIMPSTKRSHLAFPTPFLSTPLHALIDCDEIVVCNQAELANLIARLQYTCALYL